VLVLPWNDQQTAESVFSELGDRVAAAIAEPMQCNTASILPRAGFLERLCELTKRHGAALIFDEVITGFRLAAGGAAEYFGVQPDMAVYGKAVAGGYPLSAVAGTEAVMSAVASGRVRHFGTFNGNPIVMAAANATLEVLLDPAEDVYGRMRRLGSRLMDGLQGLSDGSLPMLVQGVPACFHLLFTEAREVLNYPGFLTCDTGHTQMWLENALLEGILQMGDARWYVSAAHTEQDIDITLERAGRILKRMASELSLSPVATG
jgi:glutamate-1-semialdehyde 2,1-aminomutase